MAVPGRLSIASPQLAHCSLGGGYAAASLDAVREGTGVTERSLYRHFRGKRELCEGVFKEAARHHRARRHRNGHAGRALGGDEAH
ncbi:TetR family transcriptional regulator [Actinomadura sp. LD22]|uniref:TetR family transcriptional regulator n=1 Tax=Actinomadura physcomitrii TaxID=2650748 RepID=A0A6I4MN46_9ACTN|nr:TetR family transcriptional regulator [Actinomadura physcomitrii]